jgi:hypothetical protein
MKYFYCLAVLISSFLYSAAQIKYVTKNGAGSKDGSSWSNAWSGKIFADTIYSVNSGTEVWIAKGVYTASKNRNDQFPLVSPLHWSDSISAHRETTFKVNSGVKIRGGFAGTETSLIERVDSLMFGVNLTYLDAFFPGDSGPMANGSGELIMLRNVSDQTLVEGFYLARSTYASISIESTGNNQSSPVINKCLFGETWSYGLGPISVSAGGSVRSFPRINSCYFVGGWGDNGAGGIYAFANCKLSIANSVFTNCEGVYGSAIGMVNTYGADIVNCTFYNNRGGWSVSDPFVGAIGASNVGDPVNISNCIFYNNTNRGVVANLYSSGNNPFLLENCSFQAQDPGYSTMPLSILNSLDDLPSFINPGNIAGPDGVFFTSDDGMALGAISTSVNTGKNEQIPSFITTDILGKQRVEGCRVDMGAFERMSNTVTSTLLPSSALQTCTQYPVSASGTIYVDTASCSVLTSITPSGTNPLEGVIKVCVSRQTTVPVIGGIPYVQRFYDIEPVENPSTSTSTVTLYYTQEEFDNYNIVAAGFPKLPVSANDLQGIANIRIQQDHGFSLTGEPGTYNGSTVYIDPLDAGISWNATNLRWEITFDVSGFSGFFLHTLVNVVPVSLVRFNGKEKQGEVVLDWITENEFNASHFEILRSKDATRYYSIGKVKAENHASGSRYGFTDTKPMAGTNFYKLSMVDTDSSKKNSSVLLVTIAAPASLFSIAPNPALEKTWISLSGGPTGKVRLEIYDLQGRKVKTLFGGTKSSAIFTIPVNVEQLPAGFYSVKCFVNDKVVGSEKLFVQ